MMPCGCRSGWMCAEHLIGFSTTGQESFAALTRSDWDETRSFPEHPPLTT